MHSVGAYPKGRPYRRGSHPSPSPLSSEAPGVPAPGASASDHSSIESRATDPTIRALRRFSAPREGSLSARRYGRVRRQGSRRLRVLELGHPLGYHPESPQGLSPVGGCPSGQREQTVNLSAQPTEVQILPPPPLSPCGTGARSHVRRMGLHSSAGRALPW